MSNKHSGLFWVSRAVAVAFGFAAAATLTGIRPVGAQQSLGLSPDQLLQRYQRSQGASGGFGTQTEAPQNVVIQPVQPLSGAHPPPSRLEQIMSARAGTRLQQFGYDQLGVGRSVTVPQTGAIQDDYVLGPGDEIVVSLRGQESNEVRLFVDRNGQASIPRLNPISATGRSFGSFRQDVEMAVRRAYVATTAFVSVGRVRQINVLVSGEVNFPGQRLLTGLSSAVDALLVSGGVRKTGSLRNIYLQRGGREYAVDLYSVLTNRGASLNLRLADGDRIVVPSLGRTVAVTGLVRQPGIYEMAKSQPGLSVRALLALAGGQEVRGQYRLSVMRILSDGRSSLVPPAGEGDLVRDSEILFVQMSADQVVGQATISGGSGLAGQFPIIQGTKLSEVVRAPGMMGQAPYTLFGVISRKDPRTLLRTLIAFTPVAVLSGIEDQILQSDDIVRPMSLAETRLVRSTLHAFLVRQDQEQEALRNPLGQPSSRNHLSIGQNGNPQPQNRQLPQTAQTSQNNQLQQNSGQDVNQLFDQGRLALDSAYTQETDIGEIGSRSQRILDAVARGVPVQQAQQDERQALMAPQLQQQQLVARQSGANLQPGTNANVGQGAPLDPQILAYPQVGGDGFYGDTENSVDRAYEQNALPQESAAANFQDQRTRRDVFPTNREAPTFNVLAQQLGVSPLVLANFFVEHQVTLDGAVRGPGIYFVGPNAVLQDLIQAAGGTVNWADESGVELISTAVDSQSGRSETRRTKLPLRQGMFASYMVKPHDELRLNQVFTDTGQGSVTVQGEVRSVGNYRITRGERLSELLVRAGGLTNTAYPAGTVFLRKSAADAERNSYVRAASQVEDELVVAMTRVGSDKISPDTFSAMQSFVNDLRNQKAMGRISIQADPSVLAARPELDPLLEAGDVIYIPQRPSTVSVLGQVMQPGSYPYRVGASIEEYIEQAGGHTKLAERADTYIVLPDGSARKMESSWLNFSSNTLPPGSAIVVPRDVTPLDLRQTVIDITQIFSQLAVSIASVAVISR